jgi:hypothetical protein
MIKKKHPHTRYERMQLEEKNKLEYGKKKEARSGKVWRKLTVERLKEQETDDELQLAIHRDHDLPEQREGHHDPGV